MWGQGRTWPLTVFGDIWEDAGQRDAAGGMLRGPRSPGEATKPRGRWVKGDAEFICSALNAEGHECNVRAALVTTRGRGKGRPPGLPLDHDGVHVFTGGGAQGGPASDSPCRVFGHSLQGVWR